MLLRRFERKRGLGLMACLATAALALAVFTAPHALAAGVFYVTGTPAAQDKLPVARVNLRTSNSGKVRLFLPGCWDRAALYAHFSKDKYPQLFADSGAGENSALTDGWATGAFAANRVTLKRSNGNALYKMDVLQGSEIPCIFIQTESGSLDFIHKSQDNREAGQMVMLNPDGSTLVSGAISEMRVRGNNTAGYMKKPYQIKLDKKASLLGGGEAKTWVLLADYMDLTLLRNRITLDMAKAAGLRYAVSCQSVDLYVNGDYLGVYLLTDKVQVNPARVDVTDRQDELEYANSQPLESYPAVEKAYPDGSSYRGFALEASPQDITGGYLLEVDKAYRVHSDSGSHVFTKYGMGIQVKEPEIVSQDQIEYLHDLLTAFDRAIRTADGVDIETGKRYDELFDMESLALKFLLEEISMNFDAKAGSQYYYKDSSSVDAKVYAGPAWDYDLTYANCIKSDPSKGYVVNMTSRYPWYNNIYRKQPAFRELVYKLYQERYRPLLMILTGQAPAPEGSGVRPLTEYMDEISASAKMNFNRWSSTALKGSNRSMGTNFNDATKSLLSFLKQRIDGLDKVLVP